MSRWSVREEFSDYQQMRAAVDRAFDAAVSALSMGEELRYDLRIILRELCCNSLEHGKTPVELYLCTCCGGEHLHVLVCDAGSGFVPCKDAGIAGALDERGRGLHIVSSLSEAMAYNGAANKVLVRLKLQ